MAASSSSGVRKCHLNPGAAVFIPKPKLIKDWYNMKELMQQIRQKHMFWVSSPKQTKHLLSQIRRMIRGTLKKAYRRAKRNKQGKLGLDTLLVRDWDTILPLPNTTSNYILEVQQFLAEIFTYTEESTTESTDFLTKAANIRTIEDLKLLYFHPLMQSTTEKLYFPIKAYGHLTSLNTIDGQDWKEYYANLTPRITANPYGVFGSIASCSNHPRFETSITGTQMLLTGFQELEEIRIHDYKQYSVPTTPYVGHEYAAEELRYLRNAKTHYNERFQKMHCESLYEEDMEMVFSTVFPDAALKIFTFFWESDEVEIDFEGHFEIKDLIEDLF